MENKLVLEYSISKKEFNTTTTEGMIKRNMQNILERKQSDFMPIAFFDSIAELTKYEISIRGISDYPLYEDTNGELKSIP